MRNNGLCTSLSIYCHLSALISDMFRKGGELACGVVCGQGTSTRLNINMNGFLGGSNSSQADFSGIPTVVLESLRVRLAQLVHSLNTLKVSVSGPVLSPWPSLHQQFNVALLQLESVVANLENVPDATQSAVVYPMDNFPVRSMDGLLTTLLRKKNLPEVEDWIKEGDDIIESERIDQSADDEFSQWAWDTAEELTQIKVSHLTFAAPQESSGWTIDKAVSFMAGQ